MRGLSFTTRTFLLSMVMIVAVLAVSAYSIDVAIQAKVRNSVGQAIHARESALEKERTSQSQQARLLARLVGGSVGLTTSLGLLQSAGDRPPARLRGSLEEQLLILARELGYDLAIVSSAGEIPVAAVTVTDGLPRAVDPGKSKPEAFHRIQGKFYETTSVAVRAGGTALGSLTVGRELDLHSFDASTPVALMRDGSVVSSTLPPGGAAQLAGALEAGCASGLEGCEVLLAGERRLVLPIRKSTVGGDYQLLSLPSLDSATREFTRGFYAVYVGTGVTGLLIAMISAAFVSRSIARPLNAVVQRLTATKATGELPADLDTDLPTWEVRQLALAFNNAATSIRGSRAALDRAYVEFVETMARALDARDQYTAGHSTRVSYYSVCIAGALGLTEDEAEVIRVGALLHDIGKIGISDAILQKPDKLTEEEFGVIKTHPSIGKRILERIGKFDIYLPMVELHHENQDGSGYPRGLRGDQTPLAARIVHLADAYDAMTSDRSYRSRMPEARVREILRQNSGTQFDPAVVQAFLEILEDTGERERQSLAELLKQTAREPEMPVTVPAKTGEVDWPIHAGPDVS